MKTSTKRMNKFLVLLMALLFYPTLLLSQSKLSGTVVDQNNKPVEFAEILLLNANQQVVKNDLTNAQGGFELTNVATDTYIVEVHQFGKTLYTKEIAVEKAETLSPIAINTTNQLKEVVIESKKKLIERKVDRLVFNVENSISATGGDAVDALKSTPNIRVKNDAISMIGKNNLSVMVDDKIVQLAGEDLINFLKTIPSYNIKSIEVITTPPAKYETEGNSGIINIKLKKTKKDSWNTNFRAVYKQAVYASGSLGTDFNFKKNKLTIFSSITESNANKKNIDENFLYYPNELWVNNNPRRISNKYFNGRIGVDYEINTDWSFGIQYMGNYSNLDIYEKNQITNIFDNNNVLQSYIKSEAITYERPKLNQFNFHNIIKLDTIGKKISMDFDYFTLKNNNDRSYSGNVWNFSSPSSYFSAINNNVQNITNYSGKIDIDFPLKWVILNFGTKISQSKTNNSISFYNNETGTPQLDPNQTNEFNFKENIQALYLSGNKKINEKIEASIGIRVENTTTVGFSKSLNQTNINNYLQLFPTAYISYTPNDNNIFNASYSRRINRPNYEQLNPFKMFDSPYSYTEGNPFLQPSYTDNLEFVYTFKNLESKIYYSKTKNGFEQLGILDSNTKISRYFVENFLNTQSLGLSESITFNPLKCWTSNNSIDLNQSKTISNSSVTVRSLSGFNSSLSTNNDFVCNSTKTFFFNVGYWISFPGTNGISTSSVEQSLNSTVKWLLINKKLQLTISGNDILKTQRPTYTSYSNSIKTEYRNYYDQQSVRLSISYKFGNKKINVVKRDFGNDEEKNRTGK